MISSSCSRDLKSEIRLLAGEGLVMINVNSLQVSQRECNGIIGRVIDSKYTFMRKRMLDVGRELSATNPSSWPPFTNPADSFTTVYGGRERERELWPFGGCTTVPATAGSSF